MTIKRKFVELRARARLAMYLPGTENVFHFIQETIECVEALADPTFMQECDERAGLSRAQVIAEALENLSKARDILRYLRPDIDNENQMDFLKVHYPDDKK